MTEHWLALLLISLACVLPCLARYSEGEWHDSSRNGYGYGARDNRTRSCCSLLSSRLEGEIYYPGDAGYIKQQNDTQEGYWSLLASSLEPACRATPKDTKDVAAAVSTLVKARCRFAVRGGGHMTWAGAANIEDGVTIDLTAMNQANTTGSVVSVGGGARWRDVYPKVVPFGSAVVGGRHGEVGVAGLLTGGGNSFFGPLQGFACDNVLNFEVVLASGKTVNANADENPDLYRALKGGSNNFGIVTRFDLKTFRQGPVWGGAIIHPPGNQAQHYRALEAFTKASGDGVDPSASAMNINFWSAAGHLGTGDVLFYAKPEPYPPILKGFTDIQPVVSNTMRIDNLTGIAAELDNATVGQFRNIFSTFSMGNDARLCERVYQIMNDALAPLLNKTGFSSGLNIQPISRAITSKASLTGGNSLGLDPKDGDFLLVQPSVGWSSPADDAVFTAVIESILEKGIAAAREAGLYREYIDLTHAVPSQDPLASYGADNLARLRATAKKYDPQGVFQKLVPGGFKLYR